MNIELIEKIFLINNQQYNQIVDAFDGERCIWCKEKGYSVKNGFRDYKNGTKVGQYKCTKCGKCYLDMNDGSLRYPVPGIRKDNRNWINLISELSTYYKFNFENRIIRVCNAYLSDQSLVLNDKTFYKYLKIINRCFEFIWNKYINSRIEISFEDYWLYVWREFPDRTEIDALHDACSFVIWIIRYVYICDPDGFSSYVNDDRNISYIVHVSSKEIEYYIEQVLNNEITKTEASEKLKISRPTLDRKIKDYKSKV